MDIAMKLIGSRIEYHRNGVDGEGFHVVTFQYREGRRFRKMVATVFEGPGRLAVLDIGETAAGNIAFAKGNSWRGDRFEADLRQAITDHDEAMARTASLQTLAVA